ncbi:hypothetical protein FACS189428_5470 [Clostridia bacterium]|nr:hypothetical protein FACS189428_5470 [Clostridia bacterium]
MKTNGEKTEINKDTLLRNMIWMKLTSVVGGSIFGGLLLASFLSLCYFQGNLLLIIVTFLVLVIGLPVGIYQTTKSFYKNWQPTKQDLEHGIRRMLEGSLQRGDSLEGIYCDFGKYLKILDEDEK